MIIVLANPIEVVCYDNRVPVFGVLHNLSSNLVEAVVYLRRFDITDALDHLLSLSGI